MGWDWFPAYMLRPLLLLELAVQVGAWGGALGLALVDFHRLRSETP